MSDERIDSYIDREGVKRDTAYMLESLNAVYDGFKNIEGIKIDLKGLSGLSGIAPSMQQAKDAAAVLAEATATVQERIAQLNGHSKEYTQVLLTQIKAQKEAAQTALIEAKASTEAAKAKAASAKAGQDVVKQAIQEKKAAQDAANEYKQLSAAYNEASLRAKNYYFTLGANHPLTVQAAKDAAALGAQLKAADATVGQFQRNVGDYSNAITKAAGGAFNAIRKIAYILPGIGIAGIFSAIFEGISTAAGALFNFGSNAEKARDKFKDFLTTTGEIKDVSSAGTYGELARVQVLAKVVEDQTNSYKKRNEALSELKDINKNYFGDLDLEKLKVGELTAKVDEYSNALIAAAVVKGFSDEIGKLAVELSKQERAFNDAGHAVDFFKKKAVDAAAASTGPQGLAGINFDAEQAQTLLQKAKGTYSSQAAVVDVLRKQMLDLRSALQDAIKEQIKFKSLTGDDGKGGKSKAEDLAERRRKAVYEAAKAEQETIAEANKAIFTDETQTHAARIIALTNYTEAKNQLITLEVDYEKGKKGILAEEVVAIDKEKNKKVEAQARETATELEKINKQIFGYVEQGLSEQEQVYDKFYKDLTERYKKYLKEKERLKKEADDKEKAEEALKTEFTKELIKASIELGKTLLEAGLERQKNAIQDQITALEAQKQKDIEVANQSIANAQDRAAAITVIEARAAAQKEQLQKKQRDLDVKKAEFEKAAAIASIIQQTAQNLVKAFPNPALIALASALGAVQLATVIAQPIPKYKHGKGAHDNYEGPAIVGDGGKHEAIIREDGTVEITDNKPQLTFVKSGDIVAPDARKLVAQQMARASASITGQMPVFVSDNTALEIRDMKNAVVGAIKKIPQPQIEVSNVIRRRIRFGDTTNTYLNSNLQG